MDHTPQDQQPSVAADVDQAAAEQTPPLVAHQDPGWPPVEDTCSWRPAGSPKALTMAKHRRSAPLRFTLRSPRLTEWVDLRSGITHLLTTEATKAGQRTHGRYVAVCGIEILAHSLTAPPHGRCLVCVDAT